MTAAIYSLRAGKRALILEKGALGGALLEANEIENMPGFQSVYGFALAEAMEKQLLALDAEIRQETVRKILPQRDFICITTEKGEYAAEKVILALGAKHRTLGIPGEERLKGKGVSWCATCDGAFFRGKTAAVVGGGNTAVQDALYLSRICEKVWLIVRKNKLKAQAILIERLKKATNIEIHFETKPLEILGKQRVEGLLVAAHGETKMIPVSAVFEAIGQQPDSNLYDTLLQTDAFGYIVTDERQQTSVSGIYAAGDICAKHVRQIITAMADGAVAAEMAVEA